MGYRVAFADEEIGNGFSVPVGRWYGVAVRIHGTFFILAAAIISVFSVLHSSWKFSFMLLVVYGPILLCTVLIHKLCQVYIYRLFGGVCDKLVLWPLGGWTLVRVPQGTFQQEFYVSIVGPLTHPPQMVVWALVMAAASRSGFRYYGEEFSIGDFSSGGAGHFFAEIGRQSVILNLLLLVFNGIVPAYPMDSASMLTAVLGQYRFKMKTIATWVGLCGGFSAAVLIMVGVIGISIPIFIGTSWFFLLVGLFLVLSSAHLISIGGTAQIREHPLFLPKCYISIQPDAKDISAPMSYSSSAPQPLKSILKTSTKSGFTNSSKTIETTFTSFSDMRFDEEAPDSTGGLRYDSDRENMAGFSKPPSQESNVSTGSRTLSRPQSQQSGSTQPSQRSGSTMNSQRSNSTLQSQRSSSSQPSQRSGNPQPALRSYGTQQSQASSGPRGYNTASQSGRESPQDTPKSQFRPPQKPKQNFGPSSENPPFSQEHDRHSPNPTNGAFSGGHTKIVPLNDEIVPPRYAEPIIMTVHNNRPDSREASPSPGQRNYHQENGSALRPSERESLGPYDEDNAMVVATQNRKPRRSNSPIPRVNNQSQAPPPNRRARRSDSPSRRANQHGPPPPNAKPRRTTSPVAGAGEPAGPPPPNRRPNRSVSPSSMAKPPSPLPVTSSQPLQTQAPHSIPTNSAPPVRRRSRSPPQPATRSSSPPKVTQQPSIPSASAPLGPLTPPALPPPATSTPPALSPTMSQPYANRASPSGARLAKPSLPSQPLPAPSHGKQHRSSSPLQQASHSPSNRNPKASGTQRRRRRDRSASPGSRGNQDPARKRSQSRSKSPILRADQTNPPNYPPPSQEQGKIRSVSPSPNLVSEPVIKPPSQGSSTIVTASSLKTPPNSGSTAGSRKRERYRPPSPRDATVPPSTNQPFDQSRDEDYPQKFDAKNVLLID